MTTLPFSSTPARSARLIIVAFLLLLSAAVLGVPTAQAAGTVTDCSTYGPGAGTLQDALVGGGTVTFACDGTIIVPEIVISQNTVLDATGHVVTLSGNNANRVLTVNSFVSLTVTHLTIANGNSDKGGGINNEGTLTVSNSTISGNTANFTDGGGIRNGSDATLTVIDSTITGNNSDQFGGGIYSSTNYAVNITGSTIKANTAANRGGGIYNTGNSMTVSNSTISGNVAGTSGGGVHNTWKLTLGNVTITGNTAGTGGALYNEFAGAEVTVGNSILANSVSPAADCANNSGTITDRGHNLIEAQSGCGFTNGVNGNIVGLDPNLGPLANNGGPTQTHALLLTSIAVNAGDNALANLLTTDQRGAGFPRINGGTVDMGAYELGCPVFPVSVINEGQLNYAIACYNAKTDAGSYTITLGQNIALTASTTAIGNPTNGVSLVIEGGGFAVDGQGTAGVRPFEVQANTTVTMNRLTVTGGNVTDEGGGIYNDGRLTISNSTISNNSAHGGGGIANWGTLTISNSTISGNSSSIAPGGGIRNGSGSVITLDSVTISANSDAQATHAAGLFAAAATVTVRNSILAGNSSGQTDCVAINSTVNDNGHNLVQTQSGCGFVDGTNGNIVGQSANLGPLADNGGGTKTHALLTGSLAINAGDTTLTTDQRGEPRPAGAADDMGAYEEQNPLAITLASFEAAAQADHVLVTWETVSELTNAGFNLYRTTTANPPAAADLLAYVPSQGPGSTQGFAYSHQDYAVTAGQAYWYWLEDVDLNGATTLHGPVSVVFVAPTAVTLSGLEAASPTPLAGPWWLAAVATALAAAAVVWRRRTIS